MGYWKNNRSRYYDDWDSDGGYATPAPGAYRYAYKPRYNMAASLETRVRSFVRALTGRDVRLVPAKGWGMDERYLYYRPEDLESATDDEVLGRMLHHLAKSIHYDHALVQSKLKPEDEQPYRHLLEALEDARADHQVQLRYPGAAYYASELWQVRRASQENPAAVSAEQRSKSRDSDPLPARFRKVGGNLDKSNTWEEYFKKEAAYQKHFAEHLTPEMHVELLRAAEERRADLVSGVQLKPNPSWEFNFAIACVQNGEPLAEVFSLPDIAASFGEAIPLIERYLAAGSLKKALHIYEHIKPYYPKPTKQDEQEMDAMGQAGGGMSQEEMEQAARSFAQKLAGASLGNVTDGDDSFFGISHRGSLEDGQRDITRQMAEYERIAAANRGTTMALMYLVRSILKDNATQRHTHGHRRGKLDPRSLHKLLATSNVRVFRKPRAISKKRYTMAVLVDQSGSMNGSNSEYAVQAAVVLCEVFDQLGLPFEVIGFDNNVVVFKRFNARYPREYMPSLTCSNGGTDDANALQTVKDHIQAFDPEHQNPKGVFVISDGCGDDPGKTKTLVQGMELQNVKVLGIGIGGMREQDLAQSYTRYVCVEDVAKLPSTLASLLRSQFRRR